MSLPDFFFYFRDNVNNSFKNDCILSLYTNLTDVKSKSVIEAHSLRYKSKDQYSVVLYILNENLFGW